MLGLLESVLWWACQWSPPFTSCRPSGVGWTEHDSGGGNVWQVCCVDLVADVEAGGHNRSSSAVEWAVLRLHVDCPHLGLRGLATLLGRVEGISMSPLDRTFHSSASPP